MTRSLASYVNFFLKKIVFNQWSLLPTHDTLFDQLIPSWCHVWCLVQDRGQVGIPQLIRESQPHAWCEGDALILTIWPSIMHNFTCFPRRNKTVIIISSHMRQLEANISSNIEIKLWISIHTTICSGEITVKETWSLDCCLAHILPFKQV